MDHKNRCRLLELGLAAVVDAVIGTDAKGAVSYLNTAAESMTGWRAGKALGRPLAEVFSVIDQVTGKPITPADESAPPADTAASHAALLSSTGLQVEIEYSAIPIRDDAARLGTVVVFRARRHAAEIALQTSNESLLANADALFEEKERAQVTLASIGDAVISANFSGRVHYLNIVAETMTGWVQADASGNEVDNIFTLVDAATRDMIPVPHLAGDHRKPQGFSGGRVRAHPARRHRNRRGSIGGPHSRQEWRGDRRRDGGP